MEVDTVSLHTTFFFSLDTDNRLGDYWLYF